MNDHPRPTRVQTLDKDCDGTVTAAEFRAGLKRLNIQFPAHRVTELIAYIDQVWGLAYARRLL